MVTIREIACESAITSDSNYNYLFQSLASIRSMQSFRYLVQSLWNSSTSRASRTYYNLNPYVGCTPNCTYCYAEYQKGRDHKNEQWGTFVDVKLNIPEVLKEQIKTLPEQLLHYL